MLSDRCGSAFTGTPANSERVTSLSLYIFAVVSARLETYLRVLTEASLKSRLDRQLFQVALLSLTLLVLLKMS